MEKLNHIKTVGNKVLDIFYILKYMVCKSGLEKNGCYIKSIIHILPNSNISFLQLALSLPTTREYKYEMEEPC